MDAELVRQLWEKNPDAILAMAPDGKVLYWNRAAETIFGYTEEEALQRRLTDLIIPTDRLEEERKLLEGALAQDLAVYESVRRRKDGSLVHVSVSSRAVRDGSGDLSFILSTKKDVTHL